MNRKKYKIYRDSKAKIIISGVNVIKKFFYSKKKLFISTLGTIALGTILLTFKPEIISDRKYEDTKVKITITVEEGQFLSTIAQKYGVTVEEIMELNDYIKDPNKIEIGDEIDVVYTIKTRKIKVKKDENLATIAEKYNTTVEQLMLINGIKSPEEIGRGDKIKVPYEEEKEIKMIDLDAWDEKLESNGYVEGIDLSYSQETMDLESVLKNNEEIDFVYIRSHYFWKNREADVVFDKFSKIAYENGVALGIYFWPTFVDNKSTKEELDIVINKLKENQEKGIYYTMPICFDIETRDAGGYDLAERILQEINEYNETGKKGATIEAFEFAINYLKENGYEVIIYTGRSTAIDYKVNDLAQLYDIDIWMSRYNNAIPVTEIDEQINNIGRQYSQTGVVDGYNFSVDLDVWYENTPRKIIENGYNCTDEIAKKYK